jgi:hypothetical protein
VLRFNQVLSREGTFYVREFTSWSRDLRVTTDGEGVVAMAGAVSLRMLADRSGLTGQLSRVLARPDFVPVHDRGRVLSDVATAIGCGARDIVDVEALRVQDQLFGSVASDTTCGRALGEVGQVERSRIAAARAAAREHMWQQLPGGPPALSLAGGSYSTGEQVVLRIDASIVQAHSRKEKAAGTYKGSFGHQPVGVWIDNTGELASLWLRPGNAAPNNAADLVVAVDEAIAQVPAPWRRDLLVTCDTAGASHEFIGWLAELDQADNGMTVQYSIGWDITAEVRTAIGMLHPDSWTPALDVITGQPRDDMDVAEITALLADWLAACGWPTSMRIFVRRRALADGEQPSLFTANGYKFSAFATATLGLSAQLLDARHRAHARVEDEVRTTKDTGLAHLPSKSWNVNLGWCQAICIAKDLLAWLRLHGDLPTDLQRAEPQTLRYRLLQVPARITRGQRRRWLRLPRHWPWSPTLAAAINAIARLPLPAS